MQHCADLESELVQEEEEKEERWDPEEDTADDLQCADSLAVANNRIGGEDFGVKKIRNLLLHSFTALNRTDRRPYLLAYSLLGKRYPCSPKVHSRGRIDL
jgi:hypothetical protein